MPGTAMGFSDKYAELHCLSNFTFLRGASHPEELVQRAAEEGYAALAITDECSLAGIVRAHQAAKCFGIKLIVGSEFQLADTLRFVLLARNRKGYGQLSGLITKARHQAAKGQYHLSRSGLIPQDLDQCLALWLPADPPRASDGKWLSRCFPGRCWIGVELFHHSHDHERLSLLSALSAELGIPRVACNDVHMHKRSRQPLQDTVTAIRLGKPLAELGLALFPNGERHLRPIASLARIYPAELLCETGHIADLCDFSLDELRYEYPQELVPGGYTPATWLRALTQKGLRNRWPQGTPRKVERQIEHELRLIGEMRYEPFFLTVHDIVAYARSRDILCQGRGSAANSAVCYALGITEVDPARLDLLFERFISKERDEPPDIDVDFEHERREEVIQYIFAKYGRHRAALAASVTTYRHRSAVRDIGKALGLEKSTLARLLAAIDRLHGEGLTPERLKANGMDAESPVIRRLLWLVKELQGFPRHLSQHVGGFVIAETDISLLVPVENAAMPERTVIQWDKTDLESLGLLKVDVLALGMLTVIRKSLSYISRYIGSPMTLASVPAEDPEVYVMLRRGDSIGVFQVESRAQMSMLPRLKPKNFYDLVIEIAIVRPGPIQGDMVHPYLRRRDGLEAVTYPSEGARRILQKTLGVPIFQEQVMQLAMVAAGFSAGEADLLRRAMAAWHRKGDLDKFEERLLNGMRERGYDECFAQQIFNQIKGFGEYGFPESHSASFALLAYSSAWLKRHHPAAFLCALLNSQPMGFYAPYQLIEDAQAHGVEIRPVDVQYSLYDCSLEGTGESLPHAVRLGFRLIKGFAQASAQILMSARGDFPFKNWSDLCERSQLDRRDLEILAAADALASISGNRHRAHWDCAGLLPAFPFADGASEEMPALIPSPGEWTNILCDFASMALTLRRHPVALFRDRLTHRGVKTTQEATSARNTSITRIAGLVICRQRPLTASGVMFMTLEDETGHLNIIVWPNKYQNRQDLLKATFVEIIGTVQHESDVTHVIASRLTNLSSWLGQMSFHARDFK